MVDMSCQLEDIKSEYNDIIVILFYIIFRNLSRVTVSCGGAYASHFSHPFTLDEGARTQILMQESQEPSTAQAAQTQWKLKPRNLITNSLSSSPLSSSIYTIGIRWGYLCSSTISKIRPPPPTKGQPNLTLICPLGLANSHRPSLLSISWSGPRTTVPNVTLLKRPKSHPKVHWSYPHMSESRGCHLHVLLYWARPSGIRANCTPKYFQISTKLLSLFRYYSDIIFPNLLTTLSLSARDPLSLPLQVAGFRSLGGGKRHKMEMQLV